MKIDTKIVLKNLKGEALKGDNKEDLTLGEALSNILLVAKEGGKMKMFLLAQKLYEGTLNEIDQSDLALLKRVVESTESIYNNLVLGQLGILLEEIKEESKKVEDKK